MSWKFNNEPVDQLPEKITGFIYIITNLIDGRKYIGKKKASFRRTTQKTVTLKSGVKKKKKIRSEIESDWMTYFGSSEELKRDVETLGSDNFQREIVRYCYSLSELTYYEAKYQFETDCLLYPDLWYNGWIAARVRRDHLIKTKK